MNFPFGPPFEDPADPDNRTLTLDATRAVRIAAAAMSHCQNMSMDDALHAVLKVVLEQPHVLIDRAGTHLTPHAIIASGEPWDCSIDDEKRIVARRRKKP